MRASCKYTRGNYEILYEMYRVCKKIRQNRKEGGARMTELIKCECGYKPNIVCVYTYWWVARCYRCNKTTEQYDTPQQAIEAWNERSGEK